MQVERPVIVSTPLPSNEGRDIKNSPEFLNLVKFQHLYLLMKVVTSRHRHPIIKWDFSDVSTPLPSNEGRDLAAAYGPCTYPYQRFNTFTF